MMRVLAAAAHPDDIEFGMAGTLLLLRKAGCGVHMWNLADGACGSDGLSASRIRALRKKEAMASARLAGARFHGPIGRDLLLFYDEPHLTRAAAVIRQVRPQILLVPSPNDYMEDHQNACRLAVTGAFVRGMPNFLSRPRWPARTWAMAVYHAQPHMNRDAMGQRVRPEFSVNVVSVWKRKQELLACHKSQKEWLDRSQGLGSYLEAQEAMAREVGKLSGRFRLAEGWRRHSHLGFGPPGWDPLWEILKNQVQSL